MSGLTCEQVEQLAPEIALGSVSGDERAGALAHLAGCAGCRAVVEDLARVADSVLLLAPEGEPPPGFESRVLRGGQQGRQRTRRAAIVGAIATAAAVAAVATAIVVHRADRPDRFGREYTQALRILGGESLRAARLTIDGRDAGEAFLYEGDPSWLFVSVERGPMADGSYRLVFEPGTRPAGGLRVSQGRGAWGGTVSGPVGGIRAVRLVAPDGRTVAEAVLSRGHGHH